MAMAIQNIEQGVSVGQLALGIGARRDRRVMYNHSDMSSGVAQQHIEPRKLGVADQALVVACPRTVEQDELPATHSDLIREATRCQGGHPRWHIVVAWYPHRRLGGSSEAFGSAQISLGGRVVGDVAATDDDVRLPGGAHRPGENCVEVVVTDLAVHLRSRIASAMKIAHMEQTDRIRGHWRIMPSLAPAPESWTGGLGCKLGIAALARSIADVSALAIAATPGIRRSGLYRIGSAVDSDVS
jgi:hypothetical protein